jgi:hypothetical protein
MYAMQNDVQSPSKLLACPRDKMHFICRIKLGDDNKVKKSEPTPLGRLRFLF